MKFEWRYRYVPDGQLEPDQFGRWAIDLVMFVHIDKSIPNYSKFKSLCGKYLPVTVASMNQKDTLPGIVPSTTDRFCVCCPSFSNAGTGMSRNTYYYSNDIEKLKRTVEKEFEQIQRVFKYCK